MEHRLTCNNLKCRRELTDEAVVTSCSHIFCLDCSRLSGLSSFEVGTRRVCPACSSTLNDSDDAALTTLNPSEDYKTRILGGLSPNVIMECAGRALSFWAYQTTQDIYYQQYLYKILTEKYSNLNTHFEKTINDANLEVESMQTKLQGAITEHDALRRRNDELGQAYREKVRKLLQVQELYNKVKRKIEMGSIQQAASDAVDSTLLGAQRAMNQDKIERGSGNIGSTQRVPQAHRPVFGGMSSNAVSSSLGHQQLGGSRRSDIMTQAPFEIPQTPILKYSQQNTEQVADFAPARPYGYTGTPVPNLSTSRWTNGPRIPPFDRSRGSFAGVGLSSGLKVSQSPANVSLGAPVRRPGL